jgi:uncharacterized membrane protein
LLVSAFVPPMMTLLVQAEHQTYLARASRIGSTIIPLLGQTPVLLLLALSIDGVVWLGRRGQWALTRLSTWVLVASMVSMFLVAGFTLVQQTGLRAQAAQGGGGGRGGSLGLLPLYGLLLFWVCTSRRTAKKRSGDGLSERSMVAETMKEVS